MPRAYVNKIFFNNIIYKIYDNLRRYEKFLKNYNIKRAVRHQHDANMTHVRHLK